VRKDRAGTALACNDEQYEPLLEFRNWLSEIRYDQRRRWKTRRNGAPGPGPLTLAARREILSRLAVVQRETGFNLLAQEELIEIQRLWRLDGDTRSSTETIWRSK
jgi:DNA sulfur modification protein DndC